MLNFEFIIIPIFAGVLSQIIKLIIDAINHKFSWKDLNSYGGMPSSHAALVISLVALIGYREGWESASLAIALVIAIITLRDAGGFRKLLGNHAKELNQIVHTISPQYNYEYAHLQERIGHTPLQLLAGSAIGVFVVVLYVLIF